ncbi:hypothetical protein GWO43_11520 [candidate division KSB1 bacterium]|nr:hypothetical protein [candidate division KSB1 bacterium]NIX71175.1 hypothetical protein [candidate division KSB1 bacterium]
MRKPKLNAVPYTNSFEMEDALYSLVYVLLHLVPIGIIRVIGKDKFDEKFFLERRDAGFVRGSHYVGMIIAGGAGLFACFLGYHFDRFE